VAQCAKRKPEQWKGIRTVSTEFVILLRVIAFEADGWSAVYEISRILKLQTRLQPLLSLPELKLLHRKVFLRALDLFAIYHLDFEDPLSIAHMEQQKIVELNSDDQGFDRAKEIERLEP